MPTHDSPSRHAVVVVAASDLGRALDDREVDITTLRGLRPLLRPDHGVHGQAIAIHESVFATDLDPPETIEALRVAFPLVDIVIWAPSATPAFVRATLLAGARDVLLDADPAAAADAVLSILDAQQLMPRAEGLGFESDRDAVFHGMLARSRQMWDLFDTAARVAQTDAPVLILGETGTGKELLARAVHRLSAREGQFVPVNCAAIAESLIDSELFGHVKGAFTGAVRDKDGLFRHADLGTLMLDEIGRIPLSAQHRLLRALQERSVRPVGAHEEIAVDVRIIAATSTELEHDVEKGRFREDLFYRLDVIRLEVPPLRRRPEDIVFLFGHFAREIARQYELNRPEVTDDFLDALIGYDWPGNVRQLENFTERLMLTQSGRTLAADDVTRHLPFDDQSPPPSTAAPRIVRVGSDDLTTIDAERTLHSTLEPHIESLERRYLELCLERETGRIARAADRAGISRRTLLRKMKQYGLDKADFKPEA